MVEAPRADRKLVPLSRVPCPSGELVLGVGTDRRRVSLDPSAGHVHALVAGQTGCGKSVALTTIAAGVCRQPELFELVALDLKPTDAPTFEPIKGALALRWPVVEDVSGAEAVIVELERMMRQRQTAKPERRLWIIVDEFHRLGSRAMDALALIAAEGRSAGMHLVLATQKIRADIVDTRVTDQLAIRILGRMQSGVAAHWAGDAGAAGLTGNGDMLVDLAGDVRRVQIAIAPHDDPMWADIPRGSAGELPVIEVDPESESGKRELTPDVIRWVHAFWMMYDRMPGVGKIAEYVRNQHGSCSVGVAQRWQGEVEAMLSRSIDARAGVRSGDQSVIYPDFGAIIHRRERANGGVIEA